MIFQAWAVHVASVALICLRLLPTALFSPVLGGPAAPSFVRLGVVLSLGLGIHFEGGVGLSASNLNPGSGFAALAARETLFGLAVGLVCTLPFEAARMGGRLIDTFRGSSAEAALPWMGAQGSAGGEFLHGLLLVQAAHGMGLSWVLQAIFRSFRWVGLGVASPTDGLAHEVTTWVAGAFVTAFSVGAPVAALALALDSGLALLSRVAPQLNLSLLGGPARLLAGAALLWAGLGRFVDPLLSELAAVPAALQRLAEVAQ